MTSTKTGGDTPIVISMDAATTFITTVQVVTSTVEATTSSDITTQTAEVVETTTESAVFTSFDVPLSNPTLSLTAVVPTTTTTPADSEEESSALSSFHISSESTLQTPIAPSTPDPASHTPALPSTPSQPKPGLGVAASVGLGVSMGIVAFLVIAGVLYAVFRRYFTDMKRNSEWRMSTTNRNRWWKGRKRNGW